MEECGPRSMYTETVPAHQETDMEAVLDQEKVQAKGTMVTEHRHDGLRDREPLLWVPDGHELGTGSMRACAARVPNGARDPTGWWSLMGIGDTRYEAQSSNTRQERCAVLDSKVSARKSVDVVCLAMCEKGNREDELTLDYDEARDEWEEVELSDGEHAGLPEM
ncbi:hypothetical protein NDU88_007248 [Pleurodeles waltl]|uniref:Uncharacterized protein n=1 Tax=Pleurodeles waltl TaxID=8319 RepID=A0AAV7VT96_PLEWA|nr:hypothetical protein NDU88_007248 [Pleurodeles waltl]